MIGAPRLTVVEACICVLVAASVPGAATAQQPEEENCIACHRQLGDVRLSTPADQFPEDIHAAKGFGCAACHGGDPTAAGLIGMDPSRGFVGRLSAQQIPQLCGRCHSDAQFMRNYNPSLRVDQVAEYQTSVHGRRLTQLGDTNVATCISCHPAHSIKPPSDPASTVHPLNVSSTCGACHASAEYMQAYGIPHDQRQRYQLSIHWQRLSVDGDLSAPTCNDCHGNHGAAPPGVSWVGSVCGQCHAVQADYFAESVHARVFTMLGVPGCAACHGNHEITAAGDGMLGLGDGAVCARCHTADVGGGAAAATMRALIDSLSSQFDSAQALLLAAEHAGMEVSQARFELGNAQTALVQARAAVHAFAVDSVTTYVREGMAITTQAQTRGERALEELQFRRAGLAVSVAIILALIGGLILKIRETERPERAT